MSIQVGDILRIVAVLNWLDGDIMQNVFNAVITGTGGPFDEGDIVDDALDWIDTIFTELDNAQVDTLDGSEIRVYIYDSIDDDWDEVGSVAWGHDPVITSDELPRGVAGLVNCKTSDPDVSGKKYFGGFGEGSVQLGLWSSSLLTLIAAAAVEWVTPFVGATSGANWTPGIWSPTNTNFYHMTGDVIIPAIPAYQRRRKQGVGI